MAIKLLTAEDNARHHLANGKLDEEIGGERLSTELGVVSNGTNGRVL